MEGNRIGRGTFGGQDCLSKPEHSLRLGMFCSFLLSILRPPKSVKIRRAQVLEAESRVEADKHIKYEGTARVGLKSLCFRPNRPYECNRENIERLKPIFRKEGLRLDSSNHVLAVIEQQALAAIRLSGIRAGQLTEYSPGGYPEYGASFSGRLSAYIDRTEFRRRRS